MIHKILIDMEKQRMFARPFSFKGRIRRLEYALSYLLYYVVFGVIEFIESEISEDDSLLQILIFVALLMMLIFILAQGAKRCHDRDNSGWWQIIPFYFLWMLFGDGDEYENNYGKAPKGRDMYE